MDVTATSIFAFSQPRLNLFAWWRHQMETFPGNWPFVQGIHRSPVNSPHKGQLRGALVFSLFCVWINGWVNNREAGDLRRFRAHYDVIAMVILQSPSYLLKYGSQSAEFINSRKWTSEISLLWNLQRSIGQWETATQMCRMSTRTLLTLPCLSCWSRTRWPQYYVSRLSSDGMAANNTSFEAELKK